MNRKKVLEFALGPILGAALSFIAVPLIAWHFRPEEIGRNSVFQISVSLSMLIFTLGLDQAYIREFHEAEDRLRLFKTCFSAGFVFLLTVTLITIPFSGLISNLLYGEIRSSWFFLTSGCVALSYLTRFFSLVIRMQERGLAYSVSQVLPKFALIVLLLGYVTLGAGQEYEYLLYANFISLTLTAVVFGWNSRSDWMPAIGKKIQEGELLRFLRFGLPLIGAGLVYWVLSATSVVALRNFSNFKELAIYSMAMNFAGLGIIFQSIFSTIWMPTVYKWVAAKEDLGKVDAVVKHVLLLACLIFSFVGVVAWVIDYILPVDYVAVKYIVVCCMAQPLLYTLSETTVVGLNIKKRSGYSLIAAAVAFVFNVIFCRLLVPEYGAAGAAISNAFAYFVFLIARTELSCVVWRPIRRREIYISIFFMLLTASGVALAEKFSEAYAARIVWFVLFPILLFKCVRVFSRYFLDKKIGYP